MASATTVPDRPIVHRRCRLKHHESPHLPTHPIARNTAHHVYTPSPQMPPHTNRHLHMPHTPTTRLETGVPTTPSIRAMMVFLSLQNRHKGFTWREHEATVKQGLHDNLGGLCCHAQKQGSSGEGCEGRQTRHCSNTPLKYLCALNCPSISGHNMRLKLRIRRRSQTESHGRLPKPPVTITCHDAYDTCSMTPRPGQGGPKRTSTSTGQPPMA